ncbi:MAG: hypothetical protein AMJ54_06465 [Deltaproteobacteria bacterium SG8_13]|nr:MAG: hypothetical protein AMJ54_06465 [Deltaproteobacteria bacterium SG8_13]
MPKKFHIHTRETAPRFHPVGKYATVEFRENCAGSCRMCVKKKCVYNIFTENVLHMSAMQEPEYLYTCMSCFRCIQECTKGIFSRTINPDYRSLGDDYWRSDILHRLWYQAHMGKIPVSGAGYRGPFVATGFDSMWTDMSEIVRPTRDGIHGREYINTCFELSRRVPTLKFNEDMSLASSVPSILEVPIPLLFQPPADLIATDSVLLAAAKAAQTIGTLMFIDAGDYTEALAPYAQHLIPRLTVDNYKDHRALTGQSPAVELADAPGVENVLADLRGRHPEKTLLVGMPVDARAADRSLALAQADVDSLHFTADNHGKEVGSDNPRFLKEMIREIHLKLVEQSLRQKINLVFAGGIAMAEHVAKAVICGADGVAIDTILLVALECRLCYRCTKGLSCPVALDEEFDTDWAAQRIVNLVGAWHSQLIEVMGAMGIREVRRLRGEVGRSMWFEDLEREHFGPIFGERKVAGLGVS